MDLRVALIFRLAISVFAALDALCQGRSESFHQGGANRTTFCHSVARCTAGFTAALEAGKNSGRRLFWSGRPSVRSVRFQLQYLIGDVVHLGRGYILMNGHLEEVISQILGV
jgi:hypothetical protein